MLEYILKANAREEESTERKLIRVDANLYKQLLTWRLRSGRGRECKRLEKQIIG